MTVLPLLAQFDAVQYWTIGIVIATFALYIGIAIWSRAGSTSEFYVAGGGVPPLANGMATAADWMSAASFLGLAGIVAFNGYSGSAYLMGWTGGYVLLALLLAPYLRKFGKFTVPDFVGDRYYSKTARMVAVICAIFVSFTYVCGQMRGVGVVFSRFLGFDVELGVIVGMALVFLFAVLGGMKGITYTQVAQYCVLIFAYTVPAVFISMMLTSNPVPQIGLGSEVNAETAQNLTRVLGENDASGPYLIDKLDGLLAELGLNSYTATGDFTSLLNTFCLTLALMVGTAGLPHVIVRFYTVKKVRAARSSAFWALLFIAILYTTAASVAVFARTNLISEAHEKPYAEVPSWFGEWEGSGLIAWVDKNDDGIIQMGAGNAFDKAEGASKLAPAYAGAPDDQAARGTHGQRLVTNPTNKDANELYVDRDIMVLANPEIAALPNWVIGLVAAGGVAAALSTAAGLLLVISTSVAHDLMKRNLKPEMSEKEELIWARCSAAVAVIIAGYFGIYPPGFVAEVVAFAFGLAAASFFPAIILGIFFKRMNREGAVAGMIVGLIFTATYIIYFQFGGGDKADYLWGIAPTGIGTIGMLVNFAVAFLVSAFTPAPPEDVTEMVERIRVPK